MNGYSSHSFKWTNDKGEVFYIKMHFKTEAGIKNMTGELADDVPVFRCWHVWHVHRCTSITSVVLCATSAAAEASAMKATDPDFSIRDLYSHIAEGKEAAWRVYAQIMPAADAASYRFNVLDITKVC
jgi:catalase